MTPSQYSGAKQYASVGLETGAVAGDPHGLIVLLYDGALEALARARRHMANGETQEKTENLHKAVNIITDGLKASLDVKSGGKLAENLASLYDFMTERLLVANQHNRIEIVVEVADLLRELGEAWKSIGKRSAHAATHAGGAQPQASMPQPSLQQSSIGSYPKPGSRPLPQPPATPLTQAAVKLPQPPTRPAQFAPPGAKVPPVAAVNSGRPEDGPVERPLSNRVAQFYGSL